MVLENYNLIHGDVHTDVRGSMSFANRFDMVAVRRHYVITHYDSNTIRAWQGHFLECKWMKCLEGSFTINLIKPKEIHHPLGNEKIDVVRLTASEGDILYIPGGYFTGIKSDAEKASLLVFSNLLLDESKQDDYRKASDFWLFKTDDI